MFTLKSMFSPRFAAALRVMTIAVVAGVATLSAQGQTSGKALIVESRNGDCTVFRLASEPVIKFTGDRCSITSEDFSATFALSEIDHARFIDTDRPSSIDEPESLLSVDLTDPGKVVVHGMKAGGQLSLYNISGVMMASCEADDAGDAVLDVSSLPAAIYIVSSQETTFKIYKK